MNTESRLSERAVPSFSLPVFALSPLVALLVGCSAKTLEFNTASQSGTLYFTASVYEDENYQAVDEKGERVVADDGRELFVRMSELREQALKGLAESEVPDEKLPQNYEIIWKKKMVKVQAEFRLHADSIVDAPLANGSASSGRDAWFVEFIEVSSAEWMDPAS